MKSKKSIIFKILLCIGVILMAIWAFLPLISAEVDGIKVIASFKIANIFGFGKIWSDINITKEILPLRALLRFLGLVVWMVPVLVSIISTVIAFTEKHKKMLLGITIVNTIYALLDTIIFIGLFRAFKKGGELLLAVSELMGFGMDASIKVAILPLILMIIGFLLSTAMLFILSVSGEKKGTSVIGDKSISISCIEGELAGSKIALHSGEKITIGREAKKVSLFTGERDPKVSRIHCEIEYDQDTDMVFVTDLSSNGTKLGDGSKLVQNAKTPVKKGTVLILSPMTKFMID